MSYRITAVILLWLLSAVSAGADLEAQYEAVRALGRLNGEALQCGHIDEVRRMKQAVVEHAPKERSFGLAFDESTNEAFLAFIERHASCPGKGALGVRVDAAIATLGDAFAQP